MSNGYPVAVRRGRCAICRMLALRQPLTSHHARALISKRRPGGSAASFESLSRERGVLGFRVEKIDGLLAVSLLYLDTTLAEGRH